MYLRSSTLVLSPTDLSAFLACRHRTGLDLAVARGALEKPEWRDPIGQALRERGLEHERHYLQWLRDQGLQVRISRPARTPPANPTRRPRPRARRWSRAWRSSTRPRSAADWRGYADILGRVETPSALGAWSYEAHDTKLARDTRGGTMLQLAAYSELLAGMQGAAPEQFHVVTPGPRRRRRPRSRPRSRRAPSTASGPDYAAF